MPGEPNLRGQILRLADLHGLSEDAVADLLDLLGGKAARASTATYEGRYESLDTFAELPTERHSPLPETLLPDERYREQELLGEGGMGLVHRVLDRHLTRTLARKVLRSALVGSPQARARFLAEARITAQLQHPGIIPVHDVGELETGQPYYTMPEVRGETLGEVISAIHRVSSAEGWASGPDGWTLRRLLGAFRRACDAVAYAHTRGIVHRDLKPDNIMLGAFGEVLVMDWGIARVLPQDKPPFSANPIVGIDEAIDRAQGFLGTPAYMPFEQASGAVGRIGPASDTYALGATLYHILSGHPPFAGDPAEVRRRVLAGPPPRPSQRGGPPIPPALEEACLRAMAREPEDRYRGASHLADAITAWLEGAQMRDRALETVARADRLRARVEDLRGKVGELRGVAAGLLRDVRAHETVDRKRPAWQKEEEAARLEREADLLELQYRETLRSALDYAVDLPEAHERLADYYAAQHSAAEARRDQREAEIQERLLRQHDRGRYAAYLQGDGALTLHTNPPGAAVRLYRYELQDRRLLPVFQRIIGATPILAMTLPIGSYLLKIQHPERAEVLYPVVIERQEHWDGRPPGEAEPRPIYLPRRGELSREECYVPAGWFWSGGDPDAGQALPRRKLWCDGLVLARFPVTNKEYIAFLDDLVAQGRKDDALRYAPRERPTAEDPEGTLIYGRSSLGRFLLVPDASGDVWLQDMPVILIEWAGMVAYCHWLRERSGKSWRLPGELEWEKGGRGVDGRLYPWGDAFDPSWCCVRESHPGRPQPVSVSAFPVDESPYGVRGMAGNTRDWCGDIYRPEGPRLEGDRALPPTLPQRADASTGHVGITRGGAWWYSPREARLTYRQVYLPAIRFHPLSFRIARSFPDFE